MQPSAFPLLLSESAGRRYEADEGGTFLPAGLRSANIHMHMWYYYQ
jgi:hypothetical protein